MKSLLLLLVLLFGVVTFAAETAERPVPPALTKPKTKLFAADDSFTSTRLEKLMADLQKRFVQIPKTLSPYGIVVDTLSPFWTPTAVAGQVAAHELQVGVSFQAPGGFADVALQKRIVQMLIDGQYKGLAISAIDGAKVAPILEKANKAGLFTVAIDSDLPKEARRFYIGTDNYKAGLSAGLAMKYALGKKGGKIFISAGNADAPNSKERVRGIKDALQDSSVTIADVLADQNQQDVAEDKAYQALQDHPDAAGFITLFSFDGPAVLRAIKHADRLKKVKVVSFDFAEEVLTGLKDGTVTAAIVQRPFYWGRLSIHVLHALNRLGPAETSQILAPYLEGENHDVIDTQVDVVTPASLGKYLKHLKSQPGGT